MERPTDEVVLFLRFGHTWCCGIGNHLTTGRFIYGDTKKLAVDFFLERYREFRNRGIVQRRCRVCGCLDDAPCNHVRKHAGATITSACHWVEWDLCSACVGKEGVA